MEPDWASCRDTTSTTMNRTAQFMIMWDRIYRDLMLLESWR
jgi:hypothetical protein